MGFLKSLFGRSPSSAQDHYEEGLAHEEQWRHDRARASFTEAIRLNPNFADAVYARAFVHEIIGDFEQALADFERVLKLNPTSGDELVVETDPDVGTSRVIRPSRGVTWAEGLVEAGVSLDRARVHYTRGVQRVDAGRSAGAIADFSAAIDLTQYEHVWEQPFGPCHPAAMYFERGRCYSRIGQMQQAIADLLEIADFEVPDREFRYQINLLLGQCLAQQEQYDEAINRLGNAIAQQGQQPEAYVERARAHRLQANPDPALADASSAIRLDPACVPAYVQRALAHADKKDLAAALADAGEAIRLAPEQSSTYAARAAIHAQAGDHAQAVADCSAAIRLDPESASLYQLRAGEYRAIGDTESAARDERTAQALTHLRETLADVQQGNWAKAMPVFDQVLALDPNLPRAYLRRGMCHLAQQQPDRAIADFDHIIEKLPKPTLQWGPTFGAYVDAFVNRGNACMMKGEFAKAAGDYTEAIRLEPKLAPAYEDRARAYRALGETAKAMADERKAQELMGDSA